MNQDNQWVNVEGLTPYKEPFWVRFANSFIKGNYFYVLSSCFILGGCLLLMRSPLISGEAGPLDQRRAFIETLKPLLVLQSYELLVIFTAIFIVKKLKLLDDAFSLFVIEIVLLLDPTFFGNAFLSMISVKGLTTPVSVVWINTACFMLVPIKLFILVKWLKLPITETMWIAFLFASFIVYMVPIPLNFLDASFSQYDYYYLMGWLPILLAAYLPINQKVFKVDSTPKDHLTSRQAVWLPRFLVFLTFGIVLSHYFEASQVYIKRYLILYSATPLLAVSLLIIRFLNPQKPFTGRLLLIDLLGLLAILFSLKTFNFQGKVAVIPDEVLAAPRIIVSNWPLLLAGTAVTGLYILLFLKAPRTSIFLRIVLLGLIGLGSAIEKSGLLGWATGTAISAQHELKVLIFSHPWILWAPIWGFFAYLAWKFPRFITWQILGVFSMIMFFNLTPLFAHNWIPEILGFYFATLILCYHLFGDRKNERFVAATIVVIAALLRVLLTPALWSVSIVILEISVLIWAGLKFPTQRAYFLIGLFQGGALSVFLGRKVPQYISPLTMVFIAGLGIFGMGLFVTFQKKLLLEKLKNFSPPPKPVITPPPLNPENK